MVIRAKGGSGPTRSPQSLHLIAETLGCPLSTFYSGEMCDEDRTIELLRLWFQIEEDQDRLKVLGMLRTLTKSSSNQKANCDR